MTVLKQSIMYSSRSCSKHYKSRGVMFCARCQELMKMFNDSNSFYYCQRADLTNTIQRRHQQSDASAGGRSVDPDDRFFWNKHMLTELIDSDVCTAVHITYLYNCCLTKSEFFPQVVFLHYSLYCVSAIFLVKSAPAANIYIAVIGKSRQISVVTLADLLLYIKTGRSNAVFCIIIVWHYHCL